MRNTFLAGLLFGSLGIATQCHGGWAYRNVIVSMNINTTGTLVASPQYCFAFAYCAAIGRRGNICTGDKEIVPDGNGYGQSSLGTGVQAHGWALGLKYGHPAIEAWTLVNVTSDVYMTSGMRTGTDLDDCTFCDWTAIDTALTTNVADLEVAFTGTGTWEAVYYIEHYSGYYDYCDPLRGNEPEALIRSATVLGPADQNPTVIGLTSNGTHTLAQGLSPAGDDLWTGEIPFSGGAGTSRFLAGTLTYTDADLDVNGDSRFNSYDVSALNALLGSSDPEHEKWDFNGSGDIDEYDVDLLAALVNNGMHSDVLGDFNGDGVACCDDTSGTGIDSYFGFVLGDANYRVELDADLDGDTDQADRDEVWFVACPGDFNRDGSLTTADQSAFNSAFLAGDMRADYNRDGALTAADYSAFNAAFLASGNCPH